MNKYNIGISKKETLGKGGKKKTEIWAEISDIIKGDTMSHLIFWQDENGVMHDETPHLPIEIRSLVDNAWLEHRRKL